MLTLEVRSDVIKPLIIFLKENESTNFNFLTDITGVHYPHKKEKEFAIVYHLHNWEKNFRLRLKIFKSRENLDVPTISDVFSAANWMERETYDFYGINFVGHPKLIKILNMEDMDYFPMRKEYPMEDATRTDKDDRFFGRDGNEGVKFDNRKKLAGKNE
ncbi:MAG: NADH-quinone oxidoreductase subunit C [Flavobacteriales bacterium]|nr:NADH-quinone oxidoreductase subunit C [Flavobacteriales bacterium]